MEKTTQALINKFSSENKLILAPRILMIQINCLTTATCANHGVQFINQNRLESYRLSEYIDISVYEENNVDQVSN